MNVIVTEFENATVCINTTGSVIKMTNRSSCAIIVTKRGTVRFTQNGNTVISAQNTPIFIPAGASYLNVCLEQAESMMVNFHANTDITEITPLSAIPLSRLEPHYEHLCSISTKSLAMPLTFSEKCHAISEIYALLCLLTDDNQKLCETEKLFKRASEIIISSIADVNLSCTLVASQLNISEVYLRRLFVKYAKIPTWKYIRKIRLEKARQLLSDNVTVKNAAYMTGFSDLYSFSRAYSDYFGYSPSKT